MYRVSVEDHFDAAHFLRGYQGKCEALHGHRFRVVVKVATSVVDDVGMAYDFTELKKHLKDILAPLDHTCLNDTPPFDRMNPSSENIATILYHQLESRLAGDSVSLACVEVWESPQTGVVYSPD
jgi:6-pyruvoyltetrahydropterin/6-carboxytetrahydropterin synthase